LGSIIGDVIIAGALAPGTSTGTLTINGNLGLNNSALFEIDKSESRTPDIGGLSRNYAVAKAVTVWK
jgi:hypothetical protein